jgi:hypothetical protein
VNGIVVHFQKRRETYKKRKEKRKEKRRENILKAGHRKQDTDRKDE